MKSLIAILSGVFITIAAFIVTRAGNTATSVDWSRAERVEMRMVEYEFVPKELRFRRDVPYQLHLLNAGTEGHDFTAPDFFSSVEIRNIEVLNKRKTSVFLEPGQTIDIYFVSESPGLFGPRCADHDWAGMTATIVIE
jgi:plastocyanin